MRILEKLNGIERIELIAVLLVFFISAFSMSFVSSLYSALPEGIVWLMVNIYNLIVVDLFANNGLDSPLWWGLGSGLSNAFVTALVLLIINKAIAWVLIGFKRK